jgi:selenocysteine lyase/cysteine desulfurase
MPFDVAAIRQDFPLANEVTYLNTASTGLIPARSRLALERFFREHAYVEALATEGLFDILGETRGAVAQLLACAPECIALTFNTSHALNLAVRFIDFQPGDNVVVARGEFPAAVYPWRSLESLGLTLRWTETPELHADVDALLSACDVRTRAVAASAVSFHDGNRPDLARLARFCSERNIRTVIDGTQACGAVNLRPAELGLDFLAAGGQKWLLSPHGTGFLYVRAELVPDLQPPILGWLNVDYGGRFDQLLTYPEKLLADARKFELGSANVHDLLMFRESLRLLNAIGIEAIETHDVQLAQELRTGLKTIPDVAPREANDSPIVSFGVPERQIEPVQQALRQARVFVSFREGRFRLSLHVYNDRADVGRALEVVEAALRQA